VGYSSSSLSIGDLDGDGKPDLAVGGQIFRNLTGLVITGQVPIVSSFSPASGSIGTTVTLTGSNFNATANQNIVFFGATKATVTAGSASSLTVSVPSGATYQSITVLNLANNLMGSSATPFRVTFLGGLIAPYSLDAKVDFPMGGQPTSVIIGDLDGDGKTDLVVSNSYGGAISIFRNTSVSGSISSSSFPTPVYFGTTNYDDSSVSIGDLDGDGKPDLVTTNYERNTVSVFRNTASRGSIDSTSFATPVDFYTGGLRPFSVSIGDLDGDGKPDLVVANNSDSTVAVLRNTAVSGSISRSSFTDPVTFRTGGDSRFVSIGDLDGDGKPDLVVVNSYNNNTISIFHNKSDKGSITSSSFYPKRDFTTGKNPSSVSIGDLDGDGKPDLVVAGSPVSIFRNTSPSYDIYFNTKVDLTISANSVSIGDLDGDGKPDLVVNTNSRLSIFQNISVSGSISSSSFAPKVDFTGGSNFVSIGDLDGDGKPDLVTANANTGGPVSVFRNSTFIISVATGAWEDNSTWNIGRIPQSGDNAIIDANHVVSLNSTGVVKKLIYRGTGTLKFNTTSSKLNTGL